MAEAEHRDSPCCIETLMALLAEKDKLVSSIISSEGGDHSSLGNTIRGLGGFLSSHGDSLPWYRMYQAYPSWQQQSQLLGQRLDMDAVLQDASFAVFSTLIEHRHRQALESTHAWHSKGSRPTDIENKFDTRKLYYKYINKQASSSRGNEFTVFEFVLKVDKPRVAICVLYRKNFRNLIRDMERRANEGNILGANQQAPVLAVETPTNSAHTLDGFLNGSRVGYTIYQASNGVASGSESAAYFSPNEDFWMDHIPYFGLDD